MRNLTVTICLTIAVLLGSAGMGWSADFQKGVTAYESGDYATALREWKPLANQGYALREFPQGTPFGRPIRCILCQTLAMKTVSVDMRFGILAFFAQGFMQY